MNEPLGIFEELQAVAAKYSRFVDPRRPEPADPRTEGDVDAFLTEVAELLAKRVLEERLRLAALANVPVSGEAQRFSAPQKPKLRVPVEASSIKHVQAVFLEILDESGYRLKGAVRFKHENLVSCIRSREVSWPRQVCMSLVREILAASTPAVGKAFGNKDHTTVMHAISRTPNVLAEWPQLSDVHAKVLAAFKAAQ